MLIKCSKALLLSDVPSFAENYKALAEEIGVSLQVESEWNDRYRVTSEVVILGSKYLDTLNRSYYSEAVLILKEGESPAPYIKEGINRFIFNYKNNYELLCAFYKQEKRQGRSPAFHTVQVTTADFGSHGQHIIRLQKFRHG